MDKKFLSYTGLQDYDERIKSYIDTGLSGKSASSHTHDGRYYTESEIDTKLSTINTNVDKIASGETVVSKATSATSATYATTATKAGTATYASSAASATNASTASFASKATNADTATYATNAGTATKATNADSATNATNANTATYAKSAGTASKLGTATVGSATKPIYLNAGVATTCTTYAGGTRLTLNGTSKAGSSVAIFAPTAGGTSGQILKSAGTASAPVWGDLDAYTKVEVDTKLSGKSATSHTHAGMATTATVDSKISTHNTSTSAHTDIREALAAVKEDVDTFFKDATISDAAKDTLKELQEYITSDVEAAAAMTASINNKADAEHGHEIADVTGLQTALDGKAASSHGTHVTWSTTSPKMNGTATVGSETKVARGDHIHPTDTTRAAKSDFDSHVASTVSHITAAERTKWNAKASTASATTASAGLMSSADKVKLNGIAEGANKYTHPTTSGNKHIPSGGASGQILRWSADGTAVWGADNNTTYTAGTGIGLSGTTFSNAGVRSVVTGTTNGTIIVNTNGTTVSVPVKGLGAAAYKGLDSGLSSTSTNPVQNKAIHTAITSLTSSVTANTSSISTLTSAIAEFEEITSADIQALFA